MADHEPGTARTHEVPRTTAGGVPRSDPARHRAYIAALQRDLNRHRRQLGATETIAIDGVWDERTEVAFRQIARVLGLEPERNVRTFRLIAGAAEARTDAERARAGTDGAAYEEQLRKRFATGAPAEAERDPDLVDIDDDELDELLDIEIEEFDRDPALGDDVGVSPHREDEVRVSVRFDPLSWQLLEHAAAVEQVSLGTMLASSIQRTAYLQRVTASGGQLLVKRGRQLYRLRLPGKRSRRPRVGRR